MCLLAVVFRNHADTPLVVAANRDEWLARPATGTRVLKENEPRLLGGRDEQGGGTWLAVSDRGLVAGLTNKPTPQGRDPAKRSRGVLPLLLADAPTARAAVERFVREVKAPDFNPCWLLVGDRESLFYLDMTTDGAPGVRELEPGIHVLENRPLDALSAKASWTRTALAAAPTWPGTALVEGLGAVLRSHAVPAGSDASEAWRPPATLASCVHAGPYGTRSSTIVVVPKDYSLPPDLRVADGPPCTTKYESQNGLWRVS